MKSNVAYIAQQVDEQQTELEAAAHDAWLAWMRLPLVDDRGATGHAQHNAAMNRLGAALAPFGLGQATNDKRRYDAREVPPLADAEAFTHDSRQSGPR